MSVHQISRMSHYVRYMQENPLEIEFLFKEMLIRRDEFFSRSGMLGRSAKRRVAPAAQAAR